jgi:hypothetical protein
MPATQRFAALALTLYIALLGGLLISGAATFSRLHALARASENVTATHHVLRTLEHTLLLISEAKSAMRGYALTADRAFRADAERAAPRALEEARRLESIFVRDADQRERVGNLRRLIELRVDTIRHNMDLVDSGERAKAVEYVRSLAGLQAMGELLDLADSLRVSEEALLQDHDQREADVRWMSWVVVGTTLALALGLGALAVLHSLDMSRRSRRLEQAIEERSAAEKLSALRERETMALTNSLPQLVWAARPNGDLEYFNERWYEYTGMAPSAERSTWQQHLHPEDVEHTMKVWTCCLRDGSPYQVEYRIRQGASGAYRWFINRAVPLRAPDGSIVRWLGTSTDIEDERRLSKERESILESEREARTVAERASRLKDEFVATVSHELRTPLNAVLGWVHILHRDSSPATLERGLEVIERNARTQAKLVDDLLDTSRALAGKLRLEIQRVNLAAVVESAIETMRPAATAKGVELVMDVTSDRTTVAADPNRIQQVAWNLISNAIKYTPRGGRVSVRLERTAAVHRLVVSDTGVGIDSEFLPYVFDRFRQFDATTTRKHGGLGLGLAIARHLVELHGGTIEAWSEGPGQGATFVVTLPISTVLFTSAPRDVQGETRSRLDDFDILVVDDDADARDLVARLLEERGARARTASSAVEAIARYTERRPDMIVSDIGMPEQDGVELVRHIRDLDAREGRRTPAVALSALARPADRARALDAGFDLYISKPVEPEELITALSRLASWPTGPTSDPRPRTREG